MLLSSVAFFMHWEWASARTWIFGFLWFLVLQNLSTILPLLSINSLQLNPLSPHGALADCIVPVALIHTDTGALASWGDAEFGQLGVKEAGGLVGGMQPRIVKGSRESHFSRVAAGGYHTLALTGTAPPELLSPSSFLSSWFSKTLNWCLCLQTGRMLILGLFLLFLLCLENQLTISCISS